MRYLNLLIFLTLIFSLGCKKNNPPATEITAKTIIGQWRVSSLVYQTYKDGKFYREDPLETNGYYFEFKGDGTVNYTEGSVSSTGTYAIKNEGGKYYYWVGIQGRYGAPDEGTAEIKMLNKDSFSLQFTTSDVTGIRYIVLETMVRK
ncbi:hypothetical protein CKK33_02445 [Mucilaginibacter sp. MD40]|uniref:hypothetical protein n=1 Tax=Mucilaginibacter sp. MD40 TaxID=2029590 RepID=UPI000BAC66DC|nr:hypothetical protein [Mucilaginibacter sp. MD40]PAW92413.1 hypothetical protein CKK33_02445 [Mucilaginibacter sp. MD40]